MNDSDGGILVGLWSGNDKDYADGTDPTSWSGSEAILKEYMKTKKPVKYAQCWVFGGTLTTSEEYSLPLKHYHKCTCRILSLWVCLFSIGHCLVNLCIFL